MVDLALNSDFSVFLDSRNGIATVSALDEFEQSVRVMVTDYLYNAVIGETDPSIIKQKIRLQVTRAARNHEKLEEIVEIQVGQDDTEPSKWNVRIEYEAGDISEFGVIG